MGLPPQRSDSSGATPLVRRRRARAAQWDALRIQWRRSANERVRKCRRVVHAPEVQLHRTNDGRAGYSGYTTCGSVWACPLCSAAIWARRGEELDRAVTRWHERGGTVAMVTLTMRHDEGDALAVLWDALSDGWAAATGNYRRARNAFEMNGVAGWVRRVEATYGRNGWHLHVHALVFLAPACAIGEHDRAEHVGGAMFAAWRARLTKPRYSTDEHGDRIMVRPPLAAPIADRGGLDVRELDLDQAREEVGRYVTKGAYEAARRSIAGELAGEHGKTPKRGNVRPWDLLNDADDDVVAAGRWAEWERASHGRRALTWSRKLRELLDLGDDVDDEDLAEDLTNEDLADAALLAQISKPDWKSLCRLPGAPARLLDLAEVAPADDAAVVIATAIRDLLGNAAIDTWDNESHDGAPARDYANSCGADDGGSVETAPSMHMRVPARYWLNPGTGEIRRMEPTKASEVIREAAKIAPYVAQAPNPFGTLALDAWWDRRRGASGPPTVPTPIGAVRVPEPDLVLFADCATIR